MGMEGNLNKPVWVPPYLCNTNIKEKENSMKSDNETLLQWSATAVIIIMIIAHVKS